MQINPDLELIEMSIEKRGQRELLSTVVQRSVYRETRIGEMWKWNGSAIRLGWQGGDIPTV